MADTPPPRKLNDYERGFNAGAIMMMDKRRSFISLEEESGMPLDWIDYTNDDERMMIAQIVSMPEYKQSFRENLLRQSQQKWRQARMQKNDTSMRFCFELGNFILDLVRFYDEAGNIEKPGDTTEYSFDSILSEDSSWTP